MAVFALQLGLGLGVSKGHLPPRPTLVLGRRLQSCWSSSRGSAGPYARQLKGCRLHVAAFAVEDEPKSADAEPAAQSAPGTLSAQNASGATTASNSSTSASSKGAARTARWSPRDMSSSQALVLGGSVATAVLLTIFRKEIGPVFKWLVTALNNLTDKSVIGSGSVESLVTLSALILTLGWTYSEFQRSKALDSLQAQVEERVATLEQLEVQVEARVEGALQRLAATEQRLAAAEAEVDQLRRELQERGPGGPTATETNGTGTLNGAHHRGRNMLN